MSGRVFSRGVVLVSGVALLLALAGNASAGERNWRVRLTGAFAGDNDGVVVGRHDSLGTGVLVSGGVGAGLNFEYRFSPKMGFEMGAIAIGGTVHVGSKTDWWHHWTAVEVGSYVPLTFSANYHPFPVTQAFDLFVGPLAAAVFHSRVGVGAPVGVEARMDLGLGVNVGADINLGRSRWSLSPGIKYISIVTDSGGRGSRIAFDPLILTFGVGFRF